MYQTNEGSTSEIRPVTEAQQFPPEYNDSFLEGVTAQLKLLLKIIQDHKAARNNNRNDGRMMFRVATMLTILENVRSRIQRCQFKFKRTETDTRPSSSNSDVVIHDHNGKQQQQQQQYNGEDDKEKLRQALNASVEAIKNLQSQCTSLADAKKIISRELAKKTNVISETEELINNLKARHQLLTKKVKKCAHEHRDKTSISSSNSAVIREREENIIELERNNDKLTEDLMTTLCKYQLMEKKEEKLQEKNKRIRAEMEEITGEVKAGLEKFNVLNESMASRTDAPANIREEITRLQHVFERFQGMVLN